MDRHIFWSVDCACVTPVLRQIAPLAALVMLIACNGTGGPEADERPAEKTGPMFVPVNAKISGVDFANMVTETPEMNYFIYEHMYSGAGVGIGDLNNDDLPDLFMVGNMVPSRIYLNKGGLRFEDISSAALPVEQDHGWHVGVTMADVNADGWLDIYVTRAGGYKEGPRRTNLLFINQGPDEQGVPRFEEKAQVAGVADSTRSTQGTFFDYDHDGDLDLYVANTAKEPGHKWSYEEMQAMIKARTSPTSRLFRNDGPLDGSPHSVPHFTDVTAQAGIWNMVFGLGLAVSDLNKDGWADIYQSNDFDEPDYMYMNKGDGSFVEQCQLRMRHLSWFGMGCDIADYNNDGFPDVVVLDMASPDHVRSKKNMGSMSSDKFWTFVKVGLGYQYMFNTLQLNNGNGTFSEVGQLAGVSKTDWSWAALFADLDNDGWKDLAVTNGYKRDVLDNDYTAKAKAMKNEGKTFKLEEMFQLIPTSKIHSFLFRNDGLDSSSGAASLAFSDVSAEWGLTAKTISHGASYADLDRDGDLDLVINHQDTISSIYENKAVQSGRANFLRVKVEGANTALGMGAEVTVHTGDEIQYQEMAATRGYLSCVENVAHFGLGSHTQADRVTVKWPDGLTSEFTNVPTGTALMVDRASAQRIPPPPPPQPLLAEVAAASGLDFTHAERPYDDVHFEVLIPHKESENGPLLSAGDANGDGLEDLFVGGGRGQSGVLFLQTTNGTFAHAASQPWAMHRDREDLGSLFFDADADGDQDLYVVSGSNEVDLRPEQFFNRLYLNDGKGNFTFSTSAIPDLMTSAMRACAGDMDGDGDLDLFVGGRVVPGTYPKAPRSYLLENDGHGQFSDVTEQRAPDLVAPGLVTDAEFLDHDGDGDNDLVVVGEWMPLSFYRNDGGRFTSANEQSGLKDTEGWWSSLTSGDVDGDGDVDLVCGNIGWNNKFHATPEHPLHVYWNDFDGNGHGDIVLAKDYKGKQVPVRGRECSSQQCPVIQERFPTYDAFANADLSAIYTPEKLGTALHLQAKHMRSCVLLNQGAGKFILRDLPAQAQTAPINGCVMSDVNNDGHIDLILAGNHWGTEVETIRYDGGAGCVLLGDGAGSFVPLSILASGLFARENVKDLALVHLGQGREPLIVVANNNGPLQAFRSVGGPALSSLR